MANNTPAATDLSDQDRQLLEQLRDVIHNDARPILISGQGTRVAFPEVLTSCLGSIVQSMLDGHTVKVLPEEKDLTTQAAADLLGVSRPYLVKLLDNGEIPCHWTGSHRRVRLPDLLTYRAQRDAERRGRLNNLTRTLDQAGLYDSDYTGQ